MRLRSGGVVLSSDDDCDASSGSGGDDLLDFADVGPELGMFQEQSAPIDYFCGPDSSEVIQRGTSVCSYA